MRRRVASALLVLVLVAPGAAAWGFDVVVPVDERLSIRTSLLVAGNVTVDVPENATSVVFGAPVVERLRFGDGAVVVYCPDVGGRPARENECRQVLTGARIRLLGGGVVVAPRDEGPILLTSPAAAVALGGGNLTINKVPAGPGAFVGGPSLLRSSSTAFEVRPIGVNASIEVRSAEGHNTFNGTRYTLRISEAESAELESRQTFLRLVASSNVTVRQAPLPLAERDLSVEDLFGLMRAVVPADEADRRADLVTAFGPFQVAPALLNGVVAAGRNLTLGDEDAGEEFVLLRVEDARLRQADGNWTGSGNASYIVRGTDIARVPGIPPQLPLLVPAIVAAVALVARALTLRQLPPRRKRLLRRLLRFAAAGVLFLVAAWTIGGVFGVNPVADAGDLSLRTRVQLDLLAAGMALLSYALLGLSAASITRSLAAYAGRPHAVVLPTLVGTVAAAGFLVVARYVLVALVGAFVRL